jgi:hypothetical protein
VANISRDHVVRCDVTCQTQKISVSILESSLQAGRGSATRALLPRQSRAQRELEYPRGNAEERSCLQACIHTLTIPNRWRDPDHAADIASDADRIYVGRLAMPIYREVSLENLALYQQILRTAERMKTLRRQIDDISREVYQRLDDFDLIIEEIEGEPFADISVVDEEMRGVVC